MLTFFVLFRWGNFGNGAIWRMGAFHQSIIHQCLDWVRPYGGHNRVWLCKGRNLSDSTIQPDELSSYQKSHVVYNATNHKCYVSAMWNLGGHNSTDSIYWIIQSNIKLSSPQFDVSSKLEECSAHFPFWMFITFFIDTKFFWYCFQRPLYCFSQLDTVFGTFLS